MNEADGSGHKKDRSRLVMTRPRDQRSDFALAIASTAAAATTGEKAKRCQAKRCQPPNLGKLPSCPFFVAGTFFRVTHDFE
jgi:hypothetical protein